MEKADEKKMKIVKILVSGDVDGAFETLFTKVNSVNKKKGPFECLLCVGSFFSYKDDEWKDVLNGKIKAPITTYILGPNEAEHLVNYPKEPGEIATNIVFLGKRGVLKTRSGLTIVYLSGVEKNGWETELKETKMLDKIEKNKYKENMLFEKNASSRLRDNSKESEMPCAEMSVFCHGGDAPTKFTDTINKRIAGEGTPSFRTAFSFIEKIPENVNPKRVSDGDKLEGTEPESKRMRTNGSLNVNHTESVNVVDLAKYENVIKVEQTDCKITVDDKEKSKSEIELKEAKETVESKEDENKEVWQDNEINPQESKNKVRTKVAKEVKEEIEFKMNQNSVLKNSKHFQKEKIEDNAELKESEINAKSREYECGVKSNKANAQFDSDDNVNRLDQLANIVPREYENVALKQAKDPVSIQRENTNELRSENITEGIFQANEKVLFGDIEKLRSDEVEKTPKVNRRSNEQTLQNYYLFCAKDIEELVTSLSSLNVVDVLLTSQWPAGISRHETVKSDLQDSVVQVRSSSLVSELVKLVKPRYHFAGLMGKNYERTPYRNHEVLNEKAEHVTRFVGLAPVGNLKKEKWLYAFNMIPSSIVERKELLSYRGPTTQCPFDASHLNVPKSESLQYFFDMDSRAGHSKIQKQEKEKNRSMRKSFLTDPKDCWFCLSNPKVEKHLLITVGNQCYLSLAKGVLVPDHLLIIPISHTLSSVSLSDSAVTELDKFKNAVVNYFYDQGKNVVFFERSYASCHLQIQAVPVPKLPESAIKDVAMDMAKRYNLKFHQIPNYSCVKQVLPQGKQYFYLEIIIDKTPSTNLLHIINGKFPLQFGRLVLSSSKILNVPDRVEWKSCLATEVKEKEMADKLRERFHPYDFTK